MTKLEAIAIIGRTQRIIASVHGVLSAEEARQYEAARDWLAAHKVRLAQLRSQAS